MSEEENEIKRIKGMADSSVEPTVQKGAIDALAVYGEKAIESISEIIDSAAIDDEVKKHGLKAIEEIKKKFSFS